jgi:hypothetical protein
MRNRQRSSVRPNSSLHSLYMSLHSSWGVMITDILDGMSDEIQICLAHHFFFSKAYGLVTKRDDKPFPLQTMFLTFEVLTVLARSIFVEYEGAFVCLFFPNPMWRFQCPRSGHGTMVCLEPSLWQLWWFWVWQSTCPSLLHCVNCYEAHASSDRNCPMYQMKRPFRNFGSRKIFLFWMPEKSSSNANVWLGPSLMQQHSAAHKEPVAIRREKPSPLRGKYNGHTCFRLRSLSWAKLWSSIKRTFLFSQAIILEREQSHST